MCEIHVWLGSDYVTGCPDNEKQDRVIHDISGLAANIDVTECYPCTKFRIDTTVPNALSVKLLTKGHSLWVHYPDGYVCELVLEDRCGESGRVLKESHNLMRLVLAGEFHPVTSI